MIFDLDGTLIETEELKALSYARAAVELRAGLHEEDVVEAFRDLVGRPREEVATALLERFDLGAAARARMGDFGVDEPWQAYVEIRLQDYEEMLGDTALLLRQRYPHNIDLLLELREDYPTGLSTMSRRYQVERMLAVLELEDLFDVVATRDDVERGKPDPEIDLLVAGKLGVPPGRCLVIEDSPAGVEAALAAGMAVVAVPTKLTESKFRGAEVLHPRWVVDDPQELSDVVRRRIKAAAE